MPQNTVQLDVPSQRHGKDNKTIMEQELEEVRKSEVGKLPKLAQKAHQSSLSKLADQMESSGTFTNLPHVSGGSRGGAQDRGSAARRGAMLKGALGHAGLEKLQAKEEKERRRIKQRILEQQQANQEAARAASSGGSRRRSRVGVQETSNSQSQEFDKSTGPMSRSSNSRPRVTLSARAGGRGGHRHRGSMVSRRGSKRGASYGGDSEWEGEDEDDDVVRGGSRVGQLLGEFGHREDWVSKTILKHQMASVVQANIKGWLTRLRWRQDKEKVVATLHEQIHAEATAKERRERLRRQLEMKAMTQKQKQVAASVMTKLFGSRAVVPSMVAAAGGSTGAAGGGGGGGGMRNKWGKLGKNLDIATQEVVKHEASPQGAEGPAEDPLGSGSDFSDLEMEDIAAVKLRAVTPPWQKVEHSQWVGQYAKLGARPQMGNLEVLWDLDACDGRLAAVKSRRLTRAPGDVDNATGGANAPFDPTVEDLPPDLINDLLYPTYLNKYARMGALHLNPLGRQGDAELLAQQAAAASAPPSDQEQEEGAGGGSGEEHVEEGEGGGGEEEKQAKEGEGGTAGGQAGAGKEKGGAG